MMSMTEEMFPESCEHGRYGRESMKTYRFVMTVELEAYDMVEAGVLVGKALQFANDLEIVKFEEVV
jgi:hypothetical protein